MLTLSVPALVFAQTPATDTTANDTTAHKTKKPDLAGHQLCFGIDIIRPVENYFLTSKYGYQFEGDYYLRNEFYGEVEAGWGGSTVTYSNLQYNTTNDFITFGFNKSLLPRDRPKDWDMMFMGMRLGVANVHRGNANFTIVDSLWGNQNGYEASQNFLAYWAELVGGMRVEIVNDFFAGWTASGKFLLDGKSFSSLSPLYIAGFGRGDKTTVFDFNVYISYAIRWDKKKKPVIAAASSAPAATPPADTPSK